MNIRPYIDTSDFFGNASEYAREKLASICIPKNLKKKECLFSEGEEGSAFYLLGSGRITLYTSSKEGKTVVVKIVKRGEVFGEVVVFERSRYPVTAVAAVPSLVFIIPKLQFLCLMKDDVFRDEYIRELIKKQRYLVERIKYLTVNDTQERLLKFIAEHAGSDGSANINMSKKELAEYLGTTPETLSRIIKALTGRNKLFCKGRIIKVLNG